MKHPDMTRKRSQDGMDFGFQGVMQTSDVPGGGASLPSPETTSVKPMQWYAMIILLLIVFGLPGATGCKDGGTGPDSRWLVVPAGAYVYSAFDSDGRTLVEGWFTLEVTESASVTGEWHLTALTDRKDIGPQVGDGKLSGAFADTVLWINLNPGWADNNVLLHGTLADGVYRGTWMWVTFIGGTSQGSFAAVRR